MSSAIRLMAAAVLPLVYLLLCAALAATVAYPVFLASGGDTVGSVRTLVSRGGQVFLILGLYPLSRWLGLTRVSLGLARTLPRQWAVGFLLGVSMLALHVMALLALEIRAVNAGGFDWGRLLFVFGKSLGIGAIVALLEETIFRGALFAGVRRFSGPAAAVAISAFYYAALHFLRSRMTLSHDAVGWDTGFRIAADGFAHLAAMPPDSFLALLLAGVLLGCIRAAVPQGLGYCMGIHAGWVFVIKAAKSLTHGLPDARWSFLVGGYDGFIGYLAAAWMGLLALSFAVAARNRARRAAPGAFDGNPARD